MIYQGRSGRRTGQTARSQLAVRLGIAVYAAVCVPLSVAPPANRVVVGAATLSDLTTMLLLLAVPIALLGRRHRS